FERTAMDRLRLFPAAGDEVALKLYELIVGSGLGVLVGPPARPLPWFEWLGREAIQPVGFAREQALIPYTTRSFSGYRLLHEYFAFPERFRFVELAGLKKALARHAGEEIELAIPLARSDGALGALVDKTAFALHCTPAINLFSRRGDRIHVTDQQAEHHVVVDRTKPMDFEVYSVERVVGYSEGHEAEQEFRPFYSSFDSDGRLPAHGYFSIRRERPALGGSGRGDSVAAHEPSLAQLSDRRGSRRGAGCGGASRVPGALRRSGRRRHAGRGLAPADAGRAPRGGHAAHPATARPRPHRLRARTRNPDHGRRGPVRRGKRVPPGHGARAGLRATRFDE